MKFHFIIEIYIFLGVSKLINDGAAVAFYSLHDGGLHSKGSQRQFLYYEWASLSKILKYQPLDAIKDYFGVKIGLYYAWLGKINSIGNKNILYFWQVFTRQC